MKKKTWMFFLGLGLTLGYVNGGCGVTKKPSDKDFNANIHDHIGDVTLDHVEKEDLPEDSTNAEITANVSVYLNPSVQTWNLYAGDYGNEALRMRNIANYMKEELIKYPFVEVYGNFASEGLSLSKSVQESNRLDVDIHLALHSNAGGGSGAEVYTMNDRAFARAMHEGWMTMHSYPNRGIKDGSHLYEVKNVNAEHVALMELLFHDQLDEARYLTVNASDIAHNLTQSLVAFIAANYQ